jgi:hypothetical protein
MGLFVDAGRERGSQAFAPPGFWGKIKIEKKVSKSTKY